MANIRVDKAIYGKSFPFRQSDNLHICISEPELNLCASKNLDELFGRQYTYYITFTIPNTRVSVKRKYISYNKPFEGTVSELFNCLFQKQ